MPTARYYATIRNETLHGDLKWLSECYCEIRDESGEGNSTFRPVNVLVCGTTDVVGHISYNGRIWDRPVRDGLDVPLCLDDSKLLYDNRKAAQHDAHVWDWADYWSGISEEQAVEANPFEAAPLLSLDDQIEGVEAKLAALAREAETGEQWAEIALIEARDLVPLQRRLTQHDRHVWDRTTFLFDRIVAELFSPAEFGWNEWSRYAASGEWI